MTIAKVFRSGNNQAVRLPKQYRLKGKEVEIYRRGEEIVLREIPLTMAPAFEILVNLPSEVFAGRRKKDLPQKRNGL